VSPIFKFVYDGKDLEAMDNEFIRPAHIKQLRSVEIKDPEIQKKLKQNFEEVEQMRQELPAKAEFNGLFLYKGFKHVQEKLLIGIRGGKWPKKLDKGGRCADTMPPPPTPRAGARESADPSPQSAGPSPRSA